MNPLTGLIHHPYRPPEGFDAPQPGVFKASTVIFSSVAAMRGHDWRQKDGYSYGLTGTPTTFLLEERIATLEGGTHCLLVPSGLAAIANVSLALLGQGDEVLIPDNAYGPNKALAEGDLARWGVTHQLYNPMDPQDLAARLSARSRLVWLEAPGSVTMEFPPLQQLAAVCRARGVPSALDNTWGAGLAFNGFDLEGGPGTGQGADIVVQALTKYPSGGADVLMGSVVTRDAALHQQIKLTHMRLGLGVAANDAEAVLRSLPTIALRYRAQDQVARQLARWLQGRPEVARVLHPALAGSPGHAHWRALCARDEAPSQGAHPAVHDGGRGAGVPEVPEVSEVTEVTEGVAMPGLAAGLFSVVLHPRYRSAQVDGFCERLRLFKLGYSWGGPMSLIVPYDVPAMRSAALGTWQEAGTLVRLSIGFESVDDLQADLAQALDALDTLG